MAEGQGLPYLGSKISLISKADIRYEGFLYFIDPKESKVTLSSVRSFGTEGRRSDREIPPSSEVYEFITFRGSDIKDLQVSEPPQPPQSHIPADPAIVSTQPPPGSFQQRPMAPNMYGYPYGMSPYMQPPYGSIPGQVPPGVGFGGNPAPPGFPQGAQPPAPSPSAPAPAAAAPSQPQPQQPSQAQPQAAQPSQPLKQSPAQPSGPAKAPSQIQAQVPAQAPSQPAHQQVKSQPQPQPQSQPQQPPQPQPQAHQPYPASEGHEGRPHVQPVARVPLPGQMRQHGDRNYQQQQGGFPPRNQNGYQGSRGRRSDGQRSSRLVLPNEDYDFESMTAKFEQERIHDDTEDEVPVAVPKYDKAKSFFDDISCDAKDKASGGARDEDRRVRHEEGKTNLETFGQASPYHGRGGYNGRGGRGGYGGYNNRGGGRGYHHQGQQGQQGQQGRSNNGDWRQGQHQGQGGYGGYGQQRASYPSRDAHQEGY